MTWAVAGEAEPTYVTERVPPPRATVTPLARSSASGKLSVELVGLLVAFGPMYRYPPLLWEVTVRLPVTAVALAGTPPTPATPKVRALWEPKGPHRPPVPLRL